MDDYEHLIYEQDGPVTVVTIDRPQRLNAIGPQTFTSTIDGTPSRRSPSMTHR